MSAVATETYTSKASAPSIHGYKSYQLGQFEFSRDEYFAHIRWPEGSHTVDVSNFLRALMRDVAWGFFYGWVHFDDVFGTCNHYGTVDVFAGSFNGNYKKAKVDHLETHPTEHIRTTFTDMIEDWTNEGFDPFAAPQETGSAYGRKHGSNLKAVRRARSTAKRCVGLQDDAPLRTDERGYTVNRAFADVAQDQPEIHAEPGFENEVHAFNLFAYLARSDVTWNPSFTSVVKHSFMCPTTEEHILPIVHGNDRVEWFFQMTDEITGHRHQGHRRAARPGDHESGRYGGDARRLPAPGILAEALHAWCGTARQIVYERRKVSVRSIRCSSEAVAMTAPGVQTKLFIGGNFVPAESGGPWRA
jgi:hypothetical protein